MSFSRQLHGGCQCGRNRYIIQAPHDASELPQVFFDTAPAHSVFQATPLPAFIRVPLAWYRSTAIPFFDDETAPQIRRAYTHRSEQHAKRSFCGFCGTPLSYWSEQPPTEADYICLTLGSLSRDDLGDLEELGLLPEPTEPVEARLPLREGRPDAGVGAAGDATGEVAAQQEEDPILPGRETLGIPWFDSIVAGSKLGTMRASSGTKTSRDGHVRVEWEVREWTSKDAERAKAHGTESPNKKPRLDGEGAGAAGMEGVEGQ